MWGFSGTEEYLDSKTRYGGSTIGIAPSINPRVKKIYSENNGLWKWTIIATRENQ